MKDLPEAKDNSFIRCGTKEKNRLIKAHAIHVSERNILYSFSIKIGEKDDSCSSLLNSRFNRSIRYRSEEGGRGRWPILSRVSFRGQLRDLPRRAGKKGDVG